jgi:RNA recognition motif-containing protein
MADDERLSPQSANELEIADEASNETKDNENKEENQKEKEEKTGGKDKEGAAATREKSPNEVSKGNPHNQPNGESIYKTDTSSTDSQSIRSRVFVGHLNTERASRRDLDKLFSECGKVVAISLLGGYGFIQYDNEESARKAIEDIHGTPFFGMKLGKYFLFSHPKFLTNLNNQNS